MMSSREPTYPLPIKLPRPFAPECGSDLDPDSDLIATPYRNGGRRTGFTEILAQVTAVQARAEDDTLGPPCGGNGDRDGRCLSWQPA
jgi:hypothetical protein